MQLPLLQQQNGRHTPSPATSIRATATSNNNWARMPFPLSAGAINPEHINMDVRWKCQPNMSLSVGFWPGQPQRGRAGAGAGGRLEMGLGMGKRRLCGCRVRCECIDTWATQTFGDWRLEKKVRAIGFRNRTEQVGGPESPRILSAINHRSNLALITGQKSNAKTLFIALDAMRWDAFGIGQKYFSVFMRNFVVLCLWHNTQNMTKIFGRELTHSFPPPREKDGKIETETASWQPP